MDLKMEVYTPSLELIGILVVQRSVIVNNEAFSAGSFSVYSIITDETKDLLQAENIIAISDDAAGIIEHIEEESNESGPYITIKGRLLTGILDRRILWGVYDLTGTPAAIMRYLVNDCAINPTRGKDADDIERRKIPGLVLADGYVDSGIKIRKQNTGGSLLEALEELGETYQVAFGVRINPKTQLMEFWTRNGVDRSIHQTQNEPVFFSTELDDVLSSAYTYDSKDYKNVALVAGEGEGLDRTSTVVEKYEETPAPPAFETCTITLSIDPEGGGVATGGGTYAEGASVTLVATAGSGYQFVAWRENGADVSTSARYTFTASKNVTVTAAFKKLSRLPAGYTEVEYIESTGTQYISTGIKPTENMEIDLEFELPKYQSTRWIFGSKYNKKIGASNNYIQFSMFINSNTSCRAAYKTNFSDVSYTVGTKSIFGIKAKTGDVYCDTSTAKISTSSTISGSAVNFSSNPVIMLFANNSEGTAENKISGKLYFFKIYDNGILKRDFVPCTNSSNVAGLYDLASNSFFHNNGTGLFIAGPAV